MTCQRRDCAECGDRLIHQSSRSARGKGLQSVLLDADIWQRFLQGEPISMGLTSAYQGDGNV